jgi:ABC-type Fe3+ transport system permease subunit
MEMIRSSETLVHTRPLRRHIQEDGTLNRFLSFLNRQTRSRKLYAGKGNPHSGSQIKWRWWGEVVVVVVVVVVGVVVVVVVVVILVVVVTRVARHSTEELPGKNQ